MTPDMPPANGGQPPQLRYDRVLAHPPQRVWAALTNPEDVMQWMAADQVILEGHVGGRFEVHGVIHGAGRVLAWKPLERFEHEFQLQTPGGAKQGGIVTYDLQPEGTGTRLTMTFRSASPVLTRLFMQGQAATFDRIEAFLRGRPPPSFKQEKASW